MSISLQQMHDTIVMVLDSSYPSTLLPLMLDHTHPIRADVAHRVPSIGHHYFQNQLSDDKVGP
eukprot:SAG31_NODE_45086_length_260_cov_0.645963_1_plen_62_part_01